MSTSSIWSRFRPRPRNTLFLGIHIAAPIVAWMAGFSWFGLLLAVVLYYVRVFGITAGYHRYFSHRSYKMGRVTQFLMAFLAQTACQGGVLWWAAHHRQHHRYSDQPGDVHSPKLDGFWYAHMGWMLVEETDNTDIDRVKDFAKFPEILWLEKYAIVPPLLLAIALYAAWGLTGLGWGFGVSTVALWHGTFCVNSLAHVMGRRVYETTDTSRNSALISTFTMGEGWHNNHHHYQRSAAQGWRWYEFDPTYWILKLMQLVGLASGVSRPPRHVIENTIARVSERAKELREGLAQRAEALSAAVQSARGSAPEERIRQLLQSAEELRTEMLALRDEKLAHMAERVDALVHELEARMLGETSGV